MMNLSPAFSSPFGFVAHEVVAQIFVPQRAMRARTDSSSRVHSRFGVAAGNAAAAFNSAAMKTMPSGLRSLCAASSVLSYPGAKTKPEPASRTPLAKMSSSGVTLSRRNASPKVSLFCVSVPVLPAQSKSTPTNSSIEIELFRIACLFRQLAHAHRHRHQQHCGHCDADGAHRRRRPRICHGVRRPRV